MGLNNSYESRHLSLPSILNYSLSLISQTRDGRGISLFVIWIWGGTFGRGHGGWKGSPQERVHTGGDWMKCGLQAASGGGIALSGEGILELRRKDGWRRMRGTQWGKLRTLRDLQQDVVCVPSA